MATWCWEAAHALYELGERVILVASTGVALPGKPAVEVITIDVTEKPQSQQARIARAIKTGRRHLSPGPDGVLVQIHVSLANRGIQPSAYILNQSSLADRSIPCPQVIAAWAYPVSILSYLRKIPLLASGKSMETLTHTALEWVGWWRRDWRGYRTADRVLPVSKALRTNLQRRSVASDLAYPGTYVSSVPDRKSGGHRLLMAAVELGEPRKRIKWMLDAMKEVRLPQGTVLQLVGESDDSIRRAAAHIHCPVELLGRVRRQELQEIMQQSHIFCFGSLLDDWGYVLVEAMANGLLPVAPAISPFDEIVGDVGPCYRPKSKDDFTRALCLAISSSAEGMGRKAWERAQELFSRQAFGRSILESVARIP